MPAPVLNTFHPLIRSWFTARFTSPTEIQEHAWRSIRSGDHVLLTAPTGSGKTLAAFLFAINQLVSGQWPGGAVRVLYVSPMKALNNDVHRNLVQPLAEIESEFHAARAEFPEIRVQTRSGDTENAERQRMYRRPPEILITTPESLNLLVTSKSGRSMLSGVAVVILDEIHAVVSEKRGTHLITAIERLGLLAGEFQRIGLSATVRPMARVADFFGGYRLTGRGSHEKRRVKLVRAVMEKKLSLQVVSPTLTQNDIGQGGIWPPLVQACKEIIRQGGATLFFTNSRRHAEKLTRLINEGEDQELAYPHHGSLARELRLAVEQKLKKGELRAIVATNSLELGIDIGDLDRVVLVQTPFSVAHAIQRIGRSGHGVGEESRGILFPLHGRDFIQAAVMARAVAEKDIETMQPVEGPLDILAQVLLAMLVVEKWQVDELYDAIRCSYPYRKLSRRHFELVLEMLAGRYADTRIRELRGRIHLDQLAGTAWAKEGTAYLLYTAGGTIPDRGSYVLRHRDHKGRIGELDEEFVWERQLGESFAMGAQVWRIERIGHSEVEVVPVGGEHNIIPFWKAEPMHRDFHLSESIGRFLEYCNETLGQPDFVDQLACDWGMERSAADYLQSYLLLQKRLSKADLPHRHHLLVEHFADPLDRTDAKQVILHTLWGGRLNYPFSLALAAAWQEQHHYTLQVFADNDCILLMLPHDFSTQDVLQLVTSDSIERLLRKKLEGSGYFGACFRQSCGRALLLPKGSQKRRMPLWLNRLRAKKLLEAVRGYEDFPILLETWRACFHDHFDMAGLRTVLDELETGTIGVSEVTTHQPTPFSDGVIWHQTNTFMYQDDTPQGQTQSSLNDTLLREVVFSSQLRPKLAPELLTSFLGKLQRTAPGYGPLAPQDLIEAVEEQLLMSADEWHTLLAAASRDGAVEENELLRMTGERLVQLQLPGGSGRCCCAIARLPLLLDGLGLRVTETVLTPLWGALLPATPIERAFALHQGQEFTEPVGLASLLSQILVTRGPVTIRYLQDLLGLDAGRIEEAVGRLAEERQVVVDRFTPTSLAPEICDAANLEILLRMLRRARRAGFEPLAASALPLFLATHQGLGTSDDPVGDLQHSLDCLFGYPAPCGAWEEYIFPARVDPYQPSHLDSLLQSSGLIWYGCGGKRISFAFAEDLELYTQPAVTGEAAKTAAKLFGDPRGRYSFFDLQQHSGMDSATLTKTLWKLVWQGYISNDSYTVLRRGIEHDFTPQQPGGGKGRATGRRAFSRWEASRPSGGPFFLLSPSGADEKDDDLHQQALIKDRIRQLLARYGLLFRDLLTKEPPLLRWQSIHKTLRLMELSGEILAGYFFRGIPGLQFISKEGFRTLQKELDDDRIFWMNAADPASLCGIGPESLRCGLPPRLPSTTLVYHGIKLVVVLKKNGRDLEISVPPDHHHLARYLQVCRVFLTRKFRPLPRLSVYTINGLPPHESPYLTVLKNFGFSESHRGLQLYRQY